MSPNAFHPTNRYFTCDPKCPERKPGCQDRCKKHQEEKAKYAADKARYEAARNKRLVLTDAASKRANKAVLRKKRTTGYKMFG